MKTAQATMPQAQAQEAGIFFSNPTINNLLRILSLDKEYVRGEGSWLYTEEGEKILDMVSGYGSLPFGHNHPALRELTRSEEFQAYPGFTTGTVNPLAEKLARRLSALCPQTPKPYFRGEIRPKKGMQDYLDDLSHRPPVYHTVFANSGAEAVEAALKLARLKTGHLTVLSLQASFHGKTLSSLSATGQEKFQVTGYSPVQGHDYVPANDLDALKTRIHLHNQGVAAKKVLDILGGVGGASIHDEETRKQVAQHAAAHSLPFNLYNLEKSTADLQELAGQAIAAFIVEPIQGEGGINPLDSAYVLAARKLCQESGILFVLDEVQTGLGRTGLLFAHQRFEGLTWDMMTLAKALGGGEFPTAALVVHEDCWDEHFGIIHTSTFSGSHRASAISMKVLDILEDKENGGKFLEEVRRKGELFRQLLRELQEELHQEIVASFKAKGLDYKGEGIITGVRGEGLMVGVEFGTLKEFNDSLLKELAGQGNLSAMVASYLLNVCHVRVAPTLSNSKVLRLQAPLTVTEEELRSVVDGLRQTLGVVRRNNLYELTRHMVRKAERRSFDEIEDFLIPGKNRPNVEDIEGLRKVGFFVHPLDPRNFGEFDPAMALFDVAENPVTKEAPEINRLWERIESVLEPFSTNTLLFHANSGEEILYRYIVIPETAGGFMEKLQSYGEEYAALVLGRGLPDPNGAKNLQKDAALYAMEKITKTKLLPGLIKFRDWGAEILGCGAYTSIVSNQCLFLSNYGMAVTSGNSFTVATSIQGAAEGARKMHIDLKTAKAAVVAASGNIGRLAARLISQDVPHVTIIGNPKKDFDSEVKPKLEELAFQIYEDAVATLDHAVEEAGGENKVDAATLKGLALALFEDPQVREMLYGAERTVKTRTEIGRQLYRLFDSRATANPGFHPFVNITVNYNLLAEQDIIISASSDVGTIIEPHHLRPGCVVVDVARPQDVSKRVAELRPDVLVMDGGVLRIPNIEHFGWNYGYGYTPLAYACMSETAMMGWAGHTKHLSHGAYLHMEDITRTRGWAKTFGVTLAGVRSFERPVDDKHIEDRYQKAQAVLRRVEQSGGTWADMVHRIYEEKLEKIGGPDETLGLLKDLPEDVRRERNLMLLTPNHVKRHLVHLRSLLAGYQASSDIAALIAG